jgi:hypothetical protein
VDFGGQVVGKVEFLDTVGDHVNWYSFFGEHLVKITENSKCASTFIQQFSFWEFCLWINIHMHKTVIKILITALFDLSY